MCHSITKSTKFVRFSLFIIGSCFCVSWLVMGGCSNHDKGADDPIVNGKKLGAWLEQLESTDIDGVAEACWALGEYRNVEPPATRKKIVLALSSKLTMKSDAVKSAANLSIREFPGEVDVAFPMYIEVYLNGTTEDVLYAKSAFAGNKEILKPLIEKRLNENLPSRDVTRLKDLLQSLE